MEERKPLKFVTAMAFSYNKATTMLQSHRK
jgi:hypothetical protein